MARCLLSRRSFLIGSGTAATAAVLAGCTDDSPDPEGAARSEPPQSTEAEFDPTDWASVRDPFPLTRDLAHFSAFVLAAPPRQVGDAVDQHRRGLDEDTLG